MSPARFQARAPAGLLWTNVGLQPAMIALWIWIGTITGPRAVVVLALAGSLVAWALAIWILARRRDPSFAILIDDRAVTIPRVLGGSDEVVLASIERATLEVTPSRTEGALALLRLDVKHRPTIVISSRLVGGDAVHATVDALRSRGVHVT
jgi:hypothetical protein